MMQCSKKSIWGKGLNLEECIWVWIILLTTFAFFYRFGRFWVAVFTTQEWLYTYTKQEEQYFMSDLW